MRRRAPEQRVWVFAAVALLHGGLIELLWSDRPRAGSATPTSPPTDLHWIRVAPSNPTLRSAANSSRRVAADHDFAPPLPLSPLPPLPAAEPSEGSASDHGPPVDWAAELERGAREATAESPAPLRDFGFPHVPANTVPKRPEFRWYHAGTHRVESLPGGGILVNLNDRCVMVIAPLPFAFCRLGKLPVDGTLFDHLRDAPSPEAAAAPP